MRRHYRNHLTATRRRDAVARIMPPSPTSSADTSTGGKEKEKEEILALFTEFPSNPLLRSAPLPRLRALADASHEPRRALVLFVSHVGGHKYAGNVIVRRVPAPPLPAEC